MVEAEKWPGVAEDIAQRIRDDAWPIGSQLPSYRDLARETGVAERTARKAVAHLAALGVVKVRRHVGVTVRAVPPSPLPAAPTAPDRVAELERRVAHLELRLDEHERGHDG